MQCWSEYDAHEVCTVRQSREAVIRARLERAKGANGKGKGICKLWPNM